MKKIARYEIENKKFPTLYLPSYSIILSAVMENFQIVIYATIEEDAPAEQEFLFAVFSTDETIDDHYLLYYRFIGTLVQSDGFTQHLFCYQ